jgi:hypothetical protein
VLCNCIVESQLNRVQAGITAKGDERERESTGRMPPATSSAWILDPTFRVRGQAQAQAHALAHAHAHALAHALAQGELRGLRQSTADMVNGYMTKASKINGQHSAPGILSHGPVSHQDRPVQAEAAKSSNLIWYLYRRLGIPVS